MSLIKDGNSVILSSMDPRFDNLNNKANEVNNRLVAKLLTFLSHSENINPSKHLSYIGILME